MTYKEALNILFEETSIEDIMAFHEAPDYWEFVGTAGGDPVRYRVYKENGKIYEK
jgi:hypothetical protein